MVQKLLKRLLFVTNTTIMKSSDRLSFMAFIVIMYILTILAFTTNVLILAIPFAIGTTATIIVYTLMDKQTNNELLTEEEIKAIINKYKHNGS